MTKDIGTRAKAISDRERSEAEFSHSICPDCSKKLYPEYFDDKGGEI
jgi:hypothetical protein